MAEAILRHLAPEWSVDSAGTGAWHVGEQPDHRTLTVLRRHGLATAHRARQVRAADFSDFELLLVMDRNNLRDVEDFRPRSGASARVALLGSFDLQAAEQEVPDPYHDDLEAFEAVYTQVERCCRGVIAAHPKARP